MDDESAAPSDSASVHSGEGAPAKEEEPREEARLDEDLAGYIGTLVNTKLEEVHSDWVHHNDGDHLEGSIKVDAAWKSCWRKLVVLPTRGHDVPGCAVSRAFMSAVSHELEGFLIDDGIRSAPLSSRWRFFRIHPTLRRGSRGGCRGRKWWYLK